MTEIPREIEPNEAQREMDDVSSKPTSDVLADTFRSLYDSHASELIKGLRWRFGNGPPDPEDVVQEAFQRVFERPDWSKIQNIRAFLWRTACNFVLSTKSAADTRVKYQPELEQIFFAHESDLSTPETVILVREQLGAINDLLEQMPERRRWAVILHRLEGWTYEQIANHLGIGRSAVAKHIHLADKAIGQLIVESDGG